MKKILILAVILSALSCKNKNKSNITPQLEKELCESLYMDKPKNNDGNIVDTFIDSSLQNTSKTALSESLKEYNANNGFVIIMETNTGKIKALVGVEKNGNLNYNTSKNIAINTPIEPGSLIKPFDVMSLLEDKKADTSSVYDAKGGKITLYGKNIIDSHLGLQKLSIKEAFLNSSNTIFAQAIDDSYGKNPNQFIENFNKFGLGLQYSQIGCNPSIPSPNSNSWAKITLPWMGFGYGVQLTPIQLLTYYNSIANNGVMVEPLLISKIQTKEKEIKKYDRPITIESWYSKNFGAPLHSKETNKKLQDILRQYISIDNVLNSGKIAISGYSATTQINYSSENQKIEYASSFVGYYPSEKPKYTILVYVNNPNVEKDYSMVAGKIAKRIAETTK